MRNLSSVLTKP